MVARPVFHAISGSDSEGSRAKRRTSTCNPITARNFDLDNLAVVGVDQVEVIEGDLSVQDLALVRRYILLNRRAILDHWNEYTDGVELIRALKSLA